ncbi:MAG: hypothetical protein RDU47_08945 [Spirochaetia bacterium]|nr:hypothetical protein [Spirochaetia bacterium]
MADTKKQVLSFGAVLVVSAAVFSGHFGVTPFSLQCWEELPVLRGL